MKISKEIIFIPLYLAKIVFSSIFKQRFPYFANSVHDSLNILATGPSLSSSVSKLKSQIGTYVFLAVNDFAVSDLYTLFKPKYYVLLDPAYWLDSDVTNKRDVENRIKLYESLIDKTTWKLNVFVPSNVLKNKNISILLANPNIVIIPINTLSIPFFDSKIYYYALKKNMCMPHNGNVLGAAIYLSLNLGFKNIYLYGADHSWTMDIRVNDKNQVCTVKRHFYEDGILEPWYKYNKEVFRMSEICGALYRHFYGYEILKKYSRYLNASIINCTPGSFIDSFERSEK